MNITAQLTDVSKVYYTEELETHALTDINLTIPEGEFLSVAGPSGCGKSTLLALLGLLDTPSGGSYHLNGNPVEELDPFARAAVRNRQIGFVFQAFNLIPEMSVSDNVGLPLNYRPGVTKAEIRDRVANALERVGMAHRSRHRPTQLSGGQQQRVAVARALVGNPRLLLADEPTGNLDSRNGQLVMELLAELHAAGATVCMVTHDPRFAEYAERTIHLFDGAIVDEEERPRAASAQEVA